jgi:hypothetical protein
MKIAARGWIYFQQLTAISKETLSILVETRFGPGSKPGDNQKAMTITVNIKPEVEAELARQAEVRGMDVPAYAATLLEQAAHPPQAESVNRPLEEFEKTLDRIAQFSDKIPVLPDEAFSRESLYQDRD